MSARETSKKTVLTKDVQLYSVLLSAQSATNVAGTAVVEGQHILASIVAANRDVGVISLSANVPWLFILTYILALNIRQS